MGTYCAIQFDGTDVLSSKSVVPDHFISLFQETDRRVTRDEEYERDDITYSTSRAVMLERLDLLGVTSEAAKTSFERWLASEREVAAERLLENGEDDTGLWKEETELLERFNFDEWRVRAKWALLNRYNSDNDAVSDPITSKMVDGLNYDNWLTWAAADERLILRALLDEMPEVNEVVLDIAQLIHGGYIDPDLFVEKGRQRLALAARAVDPVVIIGEGASDSRLLEASLRALYPELTEYFTFFDHTELSVDGGVSYLVKFLRAFATARLPNRMIAVFDNDAAGSDGYSEALRSRLPENLKPYKLPDTELARSYPTIGPQGEHLVDVNGKAASLELYLGLHCLTDVNGHLRPVIWSGNQSRTGSYQGVVKDKSAIADAFLNAIRKGGDPTVLRKQYPELVAIWEGIFTHVQEVNAKGIIEEDASFLNVW